MLDKRDLSLAVAVVVLGAAGTYLLLPHRHGSAKPARVHAVGGVLAALALLLFALFWTPPRPALSSLFFYGFSLTALAGAALTVTSRDPIHSALWFASVVLSTSGLFLLAGAQFLAAGTVIVYAGAIIVTFLFVIMLAQMEGRAPYDRTARAPFRATLTCFLLFWALLYSLLLIRPPAVVAVHNVPAPAHGEETRLPRGRFATRDSVRDGRFLVVTPQGYRQTDRITVMLDCRAIADPGVNIQWLDGVLLPDGSGTGEWEVRRQPSRDATARRIRTGFVRHDGGYERDGRRVGTGFDEAKMLR